MNRGRRSFSGSGLLLGLLASGVVGAGCATMQIGARVPPRISAQNVQYDGTSLRFLLIVESMADGTTLDRRLGATSVALVGRPVACDSETPLPAMLRDQAPPATRSAEPVQLEKGKRCRARVHPGPDRDDEPSRRGAGHHRRALAIRGSVPVMDTT